MRRQVEAGDIVGERYRVVRPIGHGAMGKVYLAENQAIGLRVAIKLLKPELLANPDFRLRFKHEAEAVAAIQHQNVARFLDLIVGDPTFLVMEFVDGPTLHQVIHQEGKLSPRRAADIGVRLAWGLHAAHKAGVIHRDLKPSNILLAARRGAGRGAEDHRLRPGQDHRLRGRAADARRADRRHAAVHGARADRARRRSTRAPTSTRSAACIYAMLCGRPPFADTNDDVQLLYKQVHEPVEPVRTHAPHVSAELEAVVMRALAKEPADRFQSAARAGARARARRREAAPRALRALRRSPR